MRRRSRRCRRRFRRRLAPWRRRRLARQRRLRRWRASRTARHPLLLDCLGLVFFPCVTCLVLLSCCILHSAFDKENTGCAAVPWAVGVVAAFGGGGGGGGGGAAFVAAFGGAAFAAIGGAAFGSAAFAGGGGGGGGAAAFGTVRLPPALISGGRGRARSSRKRLIEACFGFRCFSRRVCRILSCRVLRRKGASWPKSRALEVVAMTSWDT